MDGRPVTLWSEARSDRHLDEIVEARKDTTVIIHPSEDDRRLPPIEKKGRSSRRSMISCWLSPTIPATSIPKDLKQSTKQRFMAIEFDYPVPEIEAQVVEREAGEPRDRATAREGCWKVRNLKNHGLEEGVSTRLLIYAATLIKQGIPAERACDVALPVRSPMIRTCCAASSKS